MVRTSLLRPLLIGLLTCLLCQLITAKCPSPPYLKNASPKQISADEYETGADVQYECDEGYGRESGLGISVCQSSGKWSESDIKCEAKCPSPPYLTNASPKQISAEDEYETGADVQYECDAGYGQESGLGISTCQSSGKWSVPDIKCEAVQCGNPGKLQDGKTIGTDFKFGGIITFQCDQGYNLWSADGTSKHHHSPQIVCNADAKWSGALPQCLPVQCPELPEIANGQITITSREYGGKVVYSCDQGFRHKSGDLERRCSADGTWTGTSAVCGDNNCEDPETDEYLKRNQYIEKCVVEGSLEPGNKAKCTCKGESVEKTITCLNNGVWEVPCKVIHGIEMMTIVPIQDTTSTDDSIATPKPTDDKKPPVALIIGIVLGIIAGAAVGGIIWWMIIRRKSKDKRVSRNPVLNDSDKLPEMEALH